MSPDGAGPLLTLEPFIDAVREGVEDAGWSLSGLQKTTSTQFEGAWGGDETRSAYLFFHDAGDLPVSVDVYLDETARGLAGNLALVVDLLPLGRLPPVEDTLSRLGAAAAATLPPGYRTPLTLRFRVPDGSSAPADADVEIRFKIVVPPKALRTGASAVAALCTTALGAFGRLLKRSELRSLME